MRVLCAIDNLAHGGLQRQVLTWGTELSARGHSFHLVLIGRGSASRTAVQLGLPLTVLAPEDPGTPGALAELILASQLDVLLNVGCEPVWQLLREHQGDEPLPPVVEFWFGDQRPEPFLWGALSVAVCCNQATARDFAQIFPELADRVELLDNPVTLGATADRADRVAARESLGLPQDAFVVGALGRFAAVKRHALLIAEAAPFLWENPEARLLVAGSFGQDDGADWPSTRAECAASIQALQLERSVVLREYLPDPAALLAALDVFVSLSESEGQSLSVSEAMWMGLPVVGSAVRGIERQIPDAATGILLPVYGPTGLADALRDLRADPARRRGLGEGARRRAHERFGASRHVERLEAVLERARSVAHARNGIVRTGTRRSVLIVTFAGIERTSSRLRAHYMARCLDMFGVRAEIRLADEARLADVDAADVVVFERTAQALLSSPPGTRERARAWKRLRFLWEYALRSKPVGYDMDDYVFFADSLPHGIEEENLHFLRTATFVVANNRVAAARFRELNEAVFVVENPVDERLWNPLALRRRNDGFAFGWIAGRTHACDIPVAIEILRALHAHQPDASFLVVGAEEMRPELEDLERLRWIPSSPWHDVPHLQVNFDVNLAPLADTPENHCKGHGHLAEPALLGIPSIAQTTDSYRDLITHGHDGLLAGEPAEWVAAAAELRDDRRRRALGQAARAGCAQRFGFARIGRAYRDVLDEVLGD